MPFFETDLLITAPNTGDVNDSLGLFRLLQTNFCNTKFSYEPDIC